MMLCPLCSAPLSDRSHLSLHMKYVHKKNLKTSNFSCETCSRTYGSYDSFKIHLKKCKIEAEAEAESESETEISIGCEVEGLATEHNECSFDAEVQSYTFDCQSFTDFIHSQVDIFVAKLYSKPLLPRNHVHSIINDVTELVSNCFQTEVKKNLVGIVNEVSSELTSEARPVFISKHMNVVANLFQILKTAFSHVSTEHKRLEYFESSGYLVRPVSCEIGKMEVWRSTQEGTVKDFKKCYVELIPFVLKKFLELPDALDSIMSYMTFLQLDSTKECKVNLVQCPLWQMKCEKFSPTDIVLPINLYCDGFECNNALGPHSKCLDGVYISLPCLPTECQSSVDNIFLAMLYDASFRNEFEDAVLFSPLIKLLRKLEEDGIVVKTAEGDKKVYFVVALFLADNKAMNSLGGFMEGFSANYFCRFCTTHRSDTQTQSIEDTGALRDKISYKIDVDAKDPTATGVKSDSVLNKLPSFHITSNFAVDCFHDLSEGVCHYVLIHLLKHCIPKYFSLFVLNERIASFSYGLCDSNDIRLISDDFGTKSKLKMTGSETVLFCKVLGLLIGDKVPERDPFWLLFLKLREILDICFAKSVCVPQSSSFLKVLVSEFNSMYVCTTGDTLKPKMHNLVHYARVLQMSGPIALQSTCRFESKHRTLTIPARATSSRVKICATLALRHQLVQSYRFISNESILPKLEMGSGEVIELVNFDNFFSFRKRIPQSFRSCKLFSPSWVQYNGTIFKPGMVLLVSVNEHGPRFAELKAILVKDHELLFLFEYFLYLGFNEHIHAYAVLGSDVWSCKHPSDLYDPLPLSWYSDCLGDKYVVLRYAL